LYVLVIIQSIKCHKSIGYNQKLQSMNISKRFLKCRGTEEI